MKILTTSAMAIAATALMTTTATAGDMKAKDSAKMMTQSQTTTMVKTIDADGAVSTVRIQPNTIQKTAVLGALAEQKTDAYVVEAPSGELYINHIVPIADLPDPELDVKTVDTYTTEYRGIVFTNRVVAD